MQGIANIPFRLPLKWLGVVLLVMIIGPATDLRAHNLSVFAWVEGDTVHVESKFSGGRRPRAAKIAVYGPNDLKLLEGITDNNGAFQFTVPQRTDLKIVLSAGMGHQGQWTVSQAELDGNDTASHTHAPPQSGTTPQPSDPGLVRELTAAQVEAMVQRSLEKELAPIKRMLADKQRDQTSLKDVLGGIGYILGLVGLATYLRFRKQKK